MSKLKMNALFIAFFDCHGLIVKEQVPTGQTVIAIYYCEVMRKLCEWIRKKCPELRKSCLLIHHDNVLSHTEYIVWDCLTKNRSTVLEHPSYSADLAPSDFFLFPKLKDVTKDHYLGTIVMRVKAESHVLKQILAEDYQACNHA